MLGQDRARPEPEGRGKTGPGGRSKAGAGGQEQEWDRSKVG